MKPRTQTLDFFFTPGGFQLDSPETGLSAEQARRLSPPGRPDLLPPGGKQYEKGLPFQEVLSNSLAGVLGFEPRSTVLETVALPLNYTPMERKNEIRTRDPHLGKVMLYH